VSDTGKYFFDTPNQFHMARPRCLGSLFALSDARELNTREISDRKP
jgi:hypothetical protein